MRLLKILLAATLSLPATLKGQVAQTNALDNFKAAKSHLEAMLEGRETASFENAVYQIENAWWDDGISYDDFEREIGKHFDNIRMLASNYNENVKASFSGDMLHTKEEKEKDYQKALNNYAIYRYITSPTSVSSFWGVEKHLPYTYSRRDPMGTLDWTNTQVTHLLDAHEGNCFALAALFEIFSERLQSNAMLCTAPGHIYIRHADEKGIWQNVELASKSFPGTGTIETITYTPDAATKNGIAMRELSQKQAIALCLVYLAKGYEYKLKVKDDDFVLGCAESALKYDDRDLNAMLLKSEILENRLTRSGKDLKVVSAQKGFNDYQNWVAHVFDLGYREMPYDMKNILIKGWTHDTSIHLDLKEHHSSHAGNKNVTPTRYASLSWGLFDEDIQTKRLERYGNTVFDTKTREIVTFLNDDVLYNQYTFDPVVFAWNVDPLAQKYPSFSPYSAFANNPILMKDEDGREPTIPYIGKSSTFITLLNTTTHKVGYYTGNDAANYMKNLSNTEMDWKHMRPKPTETGVFNMKPGRYIYTEKGGWIDMAHFMFYAGDAYKYKTEGKANPIGEAVQDGYKQEFTDKFAHKSSAYSYEDLPSDKFGAEFGAKYFDPKSKDNLGTQIQNYLNKVLGATDPENAPNYKSLPKEEGSEPSRTNKTTKPVYTKDNP